MAIEELGPQTLTIRPFREDDLPAAVELWAGAFDVELPDDEARANTAARLAFSVRSDPHGSHLAERDGRMVGLAQAIQRERLWVLSSLAVRPGSRGRGAGRLLLERSLGYGDADCRLVVSSNDPRALALYAGAGLSVRPTLQAEGQVRHGALARSTRPREGAEKDVPGLAEISREVRGAPHTAEIRYALENGARLLLGQEGFVVVRPGSGLWLLVAREEDEARMLLAHALDAVGRCDRPLIRWITEEQRWAIELAEAAGLEITPYGALCVGGEPGPLRPFIPSGPFA